MPPFLRLLLLFSLSSLLPLPSLSFDDPLGHFCGTATAQAQSNNLYSLLARLSSAASATGFATASSGAGSTKLFGLLQCRQDVSASDCSACAADAVRQLPKLCPEQSDARIWYDYCFLRYAAQEFAGELDTGVGIFYYNVENVTDPERFDKELGALVGRIRAQAVRPWSRGLGKDKTALSPLVTLYGLVQCTEDLSALSCAQCVATAESIFGTTCDHKKGCRVLYSSCYARYEIYPFFFPLDDEGKRETGGVSQVAIVYP